MPLSHGVSWDPSPTAGTLQRLVIYVCFVWILVVCSTRDSVLEDFTLIPLKVQLKMSLGGRGTRGEAMADTLCTKRTCVYLVDVPNGVAMQFWIGNWCAGGSRYPSGQRVQQILQEEIWIWDFGEETWNMSTHRNSCHFFFLAISFTIKEAIVVMF